MISNFVIYSPVTGEITSTRSCPQDWMPDILGPGQDYYDAYVNDTSAYYVNLDGPEPVITPKGDYTLEALPLPCTLTIEGVEYPCTEQPVFEFNYPGTYKIEVDAGVRYLKKEFDFDYQP